MAKQAEWIKFEMKEASVQTMEIIKTLLVFVTSSVAIVHQYSPLRPFSMTLSGLLFATVRTEAHGKSGVKTLPKSLVVPGSQAGKSSRERERERSSPQASGSGGSGGLRWTVVCLTSSPPPP